MARGARVLRPEHVIVENVLGSLHDRSGAVQATRDDLERLGYRTSLMVLEGLAVGVPQARRRLFLVASMQPSSLLDIPFDRLPARDLRWAIGDLERTGVGPRIFDTSAVSAEATRERIDYLFEHGLFDLPDAMRPACHSNKVHTYKSVYGRLSWDSPAQTITSGFYSMCMGRYVHPSQRRTLTAHEAARLQFFPDFFNFESVRSRTWLATIIGNAVPPKFSYLLALGIMAPAHRKPRNSQDFSDDAILDLETSTR
jgi:DNA (cytosine-5)-methyltransferase 1